MIIYYYLMVKLTCIEDALKETSYHITHNQGDDIKYLFVGNSHGEDQSDTVKLLAPLLVEGASLHLEGGEGKVILNDDQLCFVKRLFLHRVSAQSPMTIYGRLLMLDEPLFKRFLSFNGRILCNDDAKLLEQQLTLIRQLGLEHQLRFYGLPNEYDSVRAENMKLANKRSKKMINQLSRDTSNLTIQVIGYRHLNKFWHSYFQEETYATLSCVPKFSERF